VYWIGGSVCAEKSTVAKKLASQYDLSTYHTDDHWPDHFSRVTSEGLPLPTMAAFAAKREAGEKPLGEDQADVAHDKYRALCFSFWREDFTLVVEDLLALPAVPTIVEGVSAVPWLLDKVASPGRAAVLVSYDDFRRENYMNPDRPEIVLNRFKKSRDPEAAVENIIAANVPIAKALHRCAIDRGLFALEVDGGDDPDAVAQMVAESFGLTHIRK
jgi:hypothetical protein